MSTVATGAEDQLLDDQLCFALYAASRALINRYRPLLDDLGLTYPQYLAMLVLWEDGEVSVSALGTRLQLDSGTLSPLLKRLEAAGLVARRRRAEDERSVVVRPTAEGHALNARAAAVPARIAAALGLPDADRGRLRDELRALAHHLADA